MRLPSLALLASLASLLVACEKGDAPPPPSSGEFGAKPETGPRNRPRPEPGQASQAELMFGTLCATCHGMDGSGNGPAAATLEPKPRNYTDAAWQASITDDQIRKTILLGGQGVGKSPMMPGQPQLKDQPEVLEGLVKIIRGFKK